ncbi:MAG: hypothetical protein ACP5I6_02090 [Caldisphaera sp.]|jgi:hypothetical protein|nr:hypothetical protein [Caldisphaera sp.]PMP59454.1 MAG: hypothetical protein C0202_02260 [Caldisphaera sp.]PMP88959.1 MAG: hypothetical protein C0172_01410 [Caldisphaera sp.]
MIGDVVKKFFARGQSYKETSLSQEEGIDYDGILAQLSIVKMEIDRVKTSLVNEIQGYYEKMVSSAKSKDTENMEINAAEIVLKKKVLKAVLAYGNMIELAIRRVQDTRNLESIIKIIGPLKYAMSAMDEYLTGLAPQAVTSLSNVIEATEGVIRKAGVITNAIPQGSSISELLPEASELMANALANAQKEADQLSPRVPDSFDPEVIERKVLDYIRQTNGVLSLKKASQELGIPLNIIKDTLYRLEARGIIKVDLPTQQTT